MLKSSDTFRCIAVDMGASSIRIMLGMMGPGGLIHRELRRVDNGAILHEGHERWDITSIFNEITAGIEEAVKQSEGPISSIGVDAWGVDFALLDEKGALLELPVSYRDQRTEGMQDRWNREMSPLETFQRTGINFYLFNTLYQLLSMRGSARLTRASRLLFIPSYISYLLTGKAINELTIASTSQMLAVEGQRWDPEILHKLGILEEMLGPLAQPGTRLGRIARRNEDGSPIEGVAVCGHDTASVVAAIPVEEPGSVFISAGTWCIVGMESEAPLLQEEVFQNGFTNERGYGNRYRILKNIVGLWLLQGLKKRFQEISTYEQMEELALESGPEDLFIDPDDQGFYNPADMKEAFDAFFQQTGQQPPSNPGGYIQCAYRSLAFSFRYHIELLERLSGRRCNVIHVVGGGSRSDYLNQEISDICYRPVISGPVEAATAGNILVQAVTMGKLESLGEGRAFVREVAPLKKYWPGREPGMVKQQYQKYLSIKHNN